MWNGEIHCKLLVLSHVANNVAVVLLHRAGYVRRLVVQGVFHGEVGVRSRSNDHDGSVLAVICVNGNLEAVGASSTEREVTL